MMWELVVFSSYLLSTVSGQYCQCSGATTGPPSPASECGQSKYSDPAVDGGSIPAPSIVNGFPARQNEFPWQIQLQSHGSLHCGGSILTPNYVITAAHCTDSGSPSDYSVVVGDHTLNSNEATQRTISVVSIRNHPSYGSSTANSDISILRLASPITFNENVMPICMPSRDPETLTGSTVTASGWGTTSSGGSISNTLLYVNLPLMSLSGCQSCMSVDSTEVCAGVCGNNHGDTCQGDSGGPLVWRNAAGKFELVGLTSWGYGCAASTPGVYTDVHNFITWIDESVHDELSYA